MKEIPHLIFADFYTNLIGPYWTHVIKNGFIFISGMIVGPILISFLLGREFKKYSSRKTMEKEVLFFAFRENGVFHSFTNPRRVSDWFYIVTMQYFFHYLCRKKQQVTVKFNDLHRSRVAALIFVFIAIILVVYGLYQCFNITSFYPEN